MEAKVSARSAGLNEAVIYGQLVAEPESRSLPSGSVAVSFSLTVRVPGEKTTSVPIVWYDPPKRLARWQVGDMAIVRGPIVRRFFRGGSGLGSATEVVVEQGELARQQVKVERLVAASRLQLQTVDLVSSSQQTTK